MKRPEVVIANSIADEHAKAFLALHIGQRGPTCVTGTMLPSAEDLMPRKRAAARPLWRPTLPLDSFCEEVPKQINAQHRWHSEAARCIGHALWTMSTGTGTKPPPAAQRGATCLSASWQRSDHTCLAAAVLSSLPTCAEVCFC